MSTAHLPYATGAEIGGRWITGLRRLPTEDELPDSDGIPPESDWHRDAAALLSDSIRHLVRDRADWWCAARTLLYFNLTMVKTPDFRSPDFFFVKGVPNRERKSYVLWKEGGRFPNAIVELTSEATRAKDFGARKATYERVFQTPEYFIVEPDRITIHGWRLEEGQYRPIAPVGGKLRCEQLGLDLGFYPDIASSLVAPDIYPRFFYPDGRLVPTSAEAFIRMPDGAPATVAELTETPT